MISVRHPGNFGRFGQLVNFVLLWGGLNIVLANWVLSDLFGAPRSVVLAVVGFNLLIALFSEILLYRRPGRPIQPPTLAEGTTTNRDRSAVSYHSTIEQNGSSIDWRAKKRN